MSEPLRKELDMSVIYKKIPGHVLVEDFIAPYGADLSELSRKAKIPLKRLQKLIRGQDRIDETMANQLANFYRNDPSFWLDLQERYERGEKL